MELNATMIASGAFRHLSRPLQPGEAIPCRPSLLAQLDAFTAVPREAAPAEDDVLDEPALDDLDSF